jgi:hypothetical protein
VKKEGFLSAEYNSWSLQQQKQQKNRNNNNSKSRDLTMLKNFLVEKKVFLFLK